MKNEIENAWMSSAISADLSRENKGVMRIIHGSWEKSEQGYEAHGSQQIQELILQGFF